MTNSATQHVTVADVEKALNQAVEEIRVEACLPEEGTIDALNLLTNARLKSGREYAYV